MQLIDVQQYFTQTLLEPRDYQHRIVHKSLDYFWNRKSRSVLIESPTGSGKTLMALITALAMQQKLNLRLGWVSMRTHLLKQAARENEVKNVGAKIEFFSMFTSKIPTDIDMLIVDEAQHDAAMKMAHIHNVIRPKYILGMTATPFRSDRLKLCFDAMIRDAGIHRLIQDGWLAPYDHYTIKEWTPREVANAYTVDQDRWGKSIVYFHKVSQCYEAQDILKQHGVTCEVVTGTSNIDRQIEAFTTGKLRLLLNCQKLTEGFDCPDLQTVFCRPSTRGPTIQMCGRVFRKHPDLEYKQVVQAEKTKWAFTRTAAPSRQFCYDGGMWRSVTGSETASAVAMNVIAKMANITVDLPKSLTSSIERNGMARTRWRRQTSNIPSEANPDGNGAEEPGFVLDGIES